MSNQIYESGFYNESQKLRFLSHFGQTTQNAYKRVLSRAKELEEPLDKDLYNFNQLEIEQLIRYMSPKTTESAQHALNIIQAYIRWAIEENLRENNINPLDSLSGKEYLKRLVDTSAQTLFTKEEVFEVIDRLVNYQDKVVVLALFEGINGKTFSELLNLKRKDIDEDNNELILTEEDGSERKLRVSETLINMMVKAYDEKDYYKKNGNVSLNYPRISDKLELLDSPYVIKHTNTNARSTGKVEAHTISRRFKMIAEMFDMPYFNPGNVRNSGMLYEGWKAYKEHGEIRQQDYYDICNKFNTSNKDRYSYTYLKRSFLNEENIKELYGNDAKDA
jgi:site-specific recombinase XerD